MGLSPRSRIIPIGIAALGAGAIVPGAAFPSTGPNVPELASGLSAGILGLLLIAAVSGLWFLLLRPLLRRRAAARAGIGSHPPVDPALRQARAEFDAIYQSVPDAVIYTDAGDAILTMNRAACVLFGQDVMALAGRRLPDLTGAAAASSGSADNGPVELQLRHADGSLRIVEWTATDLRDRDHRLTGRIHVLHDLTRQRAAERSQRELTARLNEAQAIAHVGNWEWEAASQALWWSDELFNIFGFESGTVRPDYDLFFAQVHPDDRAQLRTRVTSALQEDTGFDLEHRILRTDGAVRYVRQHVITHPEQTSGSRRIVGTLQDITEQKLASEAADRRERHLALMDQLSGLVSRAGSLEALLEGVGEKILSMFEVDRVWFVHPCDPEADAWAIASESLRPGCETTATGAEVFMTASMTELMRNCLETPSPVELDAVRKGLSEEVCRHYGITGSLCIALCPSSGRPWLLMLHQCNTARDWSDESRRLLQDVVARLVDAIAKHLLTGQLQRDILQRERTEQALRENEQRYRSIFQNAAVSLWEEDYTALRERVEALQAAGVSNVERYLEQHPEFLHEAARLIRVRDVNDVTLSMFGAESKAQLLAALPSLLTPEALDVLRGKIVALAQGKRHFLTESRFRRLDGHEIQVLMQLTFPARAAEFSNVPVSIIDITRQKETEEKLRLSATVFENTVEGVNITDGNFRIITVNKAFTEITGYTAAEVEGKVSHVIRAISEDPEADRAMWAAIRAHGQWQGEIWDSRKNGEVYPAWLTISAVRNAQGHTSHYVAVFDDITVLKRSQEQLDHLAHHDPLTNLPNRLLFNDRLQHAIHHAHRQRTRLALLFLDLDRFKNVNDTQGHPVGDRLLQEVAQRLSACVREDDTVARLGGDEFTVIIENAADTDGIARIAHKILAAMARPFRLNEDEIYLTTSIGISLYPRDGRDATSLIKNADVAMYRAKEMGRNTYQFYRPELASNARERFSLEGSLRRALDQNEFLLHFQPQVDVRGGTLTGAEALVRWEHPKLGLIPPDKFIALAEETGLIAPLGEWILDEACRQHHAWCEAGFAPVPIAVNLSVGQVGPELPDLLERTLATHAMASRYLDVEITESLIMSNAEENVRTLQAISELGARISLDDFGTGYSSLSYLKRFPIHTVKIDKSFVRDLVSDPDDAAIIRAIIAMARSLRLDVIAEGVETTEQLAMLRRLRCDTYQGFLFSPPLCSRDFERYLVRRQTEPLPV